MQCNFIREHIADYFDETLTIEQTEMIREHLDGCASCARDLEEYRKIAGILTPAESIRKDRKTIPLAAVHTSGRMVEKPSSSHGISRLLHPTWKKVASLAAVLLIAFIFIPLLHLNDSDGSARAQTLIDKSIEAIASTRNMIMTLQLRSVKGESFDIIDINSDFETCRIWKVFDSPERWKVEKQGMTVMLKEGKQYRYMEKTGVGYVSDPSAGFLDWMRIFLNPAQILQTEKDCSRDHKAQYDITKTATETTLTVKAKAMGEFGNTYRLNGSILESNNRRVYHFDAATGLLRSAEIFISDKGKETEVLKVTEIQYDTEIAESVFTIDLPAGAEWLTLAQANPGKTNPDWNSPLALTKAFLEACANRDWPTIFKIDPSWEHSAKLESFKEIYGGIKIISIGKPFKSGRYPGTFVPCTIKNTAGDVSTHNIAVRNDNPGKVWILDGGY